MRKAVITYNYGNYDHVEPIYWKTEGWDYLLFDATMDKVPEGWKLILLPEDYFHSKDPKRRANQVKYSPFTTCKEHLNEEYDMLIVIDANMSVNGDLNDFVDTYCMSSMDGVFLIHPSIDNAYEDIDLCAELEKDEHDILLKTYTHFKKRLSRRQQILSNGELASVAIPSAWRIIEYWFYKEYEKFSKRDQPMMNFLRWKYDVLDLNLIDVTHIHEYLKYETHHFEKE